MSNFSCTEGVLVEIANQQVRTLWCVGLHSSLSFVWEEVRRVRRGRGEGGGIETDIEVEESVVWQQYMDINLRGECQLHVPTVDRTTLICSELTPSSPHPCFFVHPNPAFSIATQQRALAEAQYLTTSKYLSLQVLLDGCAYYITSLFRVLTSGAWDRLHSDPRGICIRVFARGHGGSVGEPQVLLSMRVYRRGTIYKLTITEQPTRCRLFLNFSKRFNSLSSKSVTDPGLLLKRSFQRWHTRASRASYSRRRKYHHS